MAIPPKNKEHEEPQNRRTTETGALWANRGSKIEDGG
jgi:hypothetical protein